MCERGIGGGGGGGEARGIRKQTGLKGERYFDLNLEGREGEHCVLSFYNFKFTTVQDCFPSGSLCEIRSHDLGLRHLETAAILVNRLDLVDFNPKC